MATQQSEEQIYEEAKKRVKAKKDFYRTLGTWAAVNIVLIIIWALTNFGGNPWFLWPLCLWGAYVLYKGLQVFVFERKSDRVAIEKEVERIKRED